jgi:hypothetical protein
MRIKMRDCNGAKISVDYVTTMVRDALNVVIGTDEAEPEAMTYMLTGDTLVLAVNHGNYPEVYVAKIVRYGCPSNDDTIIIDN